MNKKIICLCIIVSFILSGCWDKVELESRGFAVSIGIDRGTEKRFLVSIALPNLSSVAGEGQGEKEILLSAENDTVIGGINDIDSFSSQKLFFGHTKILVFGKDLLSDDELFRESLDAIKRNSQISSTILVLCAEKAIDVLGGKTELDPLLGIYVSNHYKNSPSNAFISFKRDMESLLSDLALSGDVLIPKISIEKEEDKGENKQGQDNKEGQDKEAGRDSKNHKIIIGGGGIIKDYKLVGFIDGNDMSGYSYLKGLPGHSQVTTDFEGVKTVLTANEIYSIVKFSQEEDRLRLNVKIGIEGSVESFKYSKNADLTPEKIDELEGYFSQTISDEVIKTADIFQKEYETDGFALLDNLRKNNPDLYQIYKDNWDETFKNIEIVPEVNVIIRNTGQIK